MSNLAEKICDYLLEYDNSCPIFKLNKYQIIKRERDFTDKEKEDLFDIKERFKNDMEIMCGVSILLGNKGDFEYYFQKLSHETQEEFLKDPIYFLYKEKTAK